MKTTAERDAIVRDARRLRVAMTHVPHDDEYLPVLAYRVQQEIEAAERKLNQLRSLRVRISNERLHDAQKAS